MAEKNADQVADWNGQSGARWVATQARLDAMVAVFGQAAIEAAAPANGERGFRPHVKTTKCEQVARAQMEAGAREITVSTLKEAEQ